MNTVTLSGNLTRDPKLIPLKSDKKLVALTIANNRKFGDKEETAYIDAYAWGVAAAICMENLSKGSRVAVHGRLSSSTKEEEGGKNRTKIFVTIDEVFIGSASKAKKAEPKEDNLSEIPF